MSKSTSRREFLKNASKLGALGVAAPLGLNLTALRAAAAANATDDYKALVCIFLYGGNDQYNTIVSADDESHRRYARVRGGTAIPQSQLGSTMLSPDNAWDDGRSFALNPNLSALKPVFDGGQLSLVMNVGTLVQPINIGDYKANRNLPPKLMSHNDQFSLWQTSLVEGARSGWGGRMGDLFASMNGQSDILTNITVGPSAGFSSGRSVQEFALGASGPVGLDETYAGEHGPEVVRAIEQMLAKQRSHVFDVELARRSATVTRGNAYLTNALSQAPMVSMPETGLGAQLEMVARIISTHQNLGLKRNVFFVGMGGFDSHQTLGSDHPLLLKELGDAMGAFQNTLNMQGLDQNVTTFTASDFGRSLTTNGRGSDHGWGGHHMVMGGAVKERSWVGGLPSLNMKGHDDIGQGRLLPSISSDQYSATLARWMGVPDSELSTVIPGIGNYNTADLGFMA